MYILATETLEDGTIKITYGDEFGNIVGYGYFNPADDDQDPGAQTSDFPVLSSVFEEWEEHPYTFASTEPDSSTGVVGNYYLRTNNVNPALWSWYGPKADSGTIWPLVGTVADVSQIINGAPYGDCSNGKDILWDTLNLKVYDNYTPEGKNSRTLVRYDQATNTWLQSKGDFVLAARGGGHALSVSNAVSNPSSTLPFTLDVQFGTYHDVTLAGNSYILMGFPTVDYQVQASSLYVLVRQDGTGGRALNWSNFMTVNWAGGVTPDMPQAANAWALFNFITHNNGQSYFARKVMDSANPPVVTLDSLGNVTAPSPSSGDFLKWNGTAWVNDAIDLGTDTTGNYVSDVSSGTGISVSHTPGEGSTATVSLNATLDDLSNVTVPSPSNGQALVWNGSAWVNSAVTASVAALDDVGNVTAPSPTSGDFLKWNGTAWVNDPIDLGTDTTGNYVADVTSGTGITVTHTPGEASSASVALNAALDNLTDVVITTPTEFDTLEYNGTNWINKHASVVTRVKNAEATTLNVGEVVYIFGASGDMATVKRADNDIDTTSAKTLGIVATSMAANAEGSVITRGYVDGINLSTGYTPGDILWLGEDGGFTNTKPTSPDHLVFIGVVCRANANGIIYVAVQNGYELDELHDVTIDYSTISDGQVLTWDSATSLWKPETPSGGGGGASVKSDFVSPYSYMGVAPSGSATSAAVWDITRIEMDTGFPVTTATGVKWDDRLTETYS